MENSTNIFDLDSAILPHAQPKDFRGNWRPQLLLPHNYKKTITKYTRKKNAKKKNGKT